MEGTITRTGKRVRHNILRKSEITFEESRRQKLSWLDKLTANMDLEVIEIERTNLKLEF